MYRKKVLTWTISLLMLVLLTACGSVRPAERTATSVTAEKVIVTITVTEDNGAKKIANEEISTEAGTALYSLMQDNFDIEDQEGFITAINGVKQDESAGKYWLFDINGEPAMKGAKDIEPETGDVISWDLHGNP